MAQAKYCTIDQLCGSSTLGGYLPDMTDTKNRNKAEEIIERISADIDDYVSGNREHNLFAPSPEEPTVKEITGRGMSFLKIPQFIPGSVSKIESKGVELNSMFWRVVEKESTIVIVDEYGSRQRSIPWEEGVQYLVTARWGYETTPMPITNACLEWCVDEIKTADGNFGGFLAGLASNPVPVTNLYVSGSKKAIPPDVERRLKSYQRVYFKQFNLIA